MGESRVGVREQDPARRMEGDGDDESAEACRSVGLGDAGSCDSLGREDESTSAKAEGRERFRTTDASGICWERAAR